MAWTDISPPPQPPITPLGWALVLLRLVPLALVIFGGLALLVLVRLIERPICGLARPISPYITQGVCRATLIILGIRRKVIGAPMQGPGAIVANHGSWLDIFALNACDRVYFVAKAEVARWPAIGWLARATGTVFIQRSGREAKRQQALFEARLRAGHRLLFFPEGTSSDAQRVLPFKSTLFAAFYSHGLDHVLSLQPVSVNYTAPSGAPPTTYGWWGDMEFAGHFIRVLSMWRKGSLEIRFHAPIPVDSVASRKALALECEQAVRAGFEAGRG